MNIKALETAAAKAVEILQDICQKHFIPNFFGGGVDRYRELRRHVAEPPHGWLCFSLEPDGRIAVGYTYRDAICSTYVARGLEPEAVVKAVRCRAPSILARALRADITHDT